MSLESTPLPLLWDPLINVKVAAERLSVSPHTILKHRALGLPTPRAFKRGQTLRFRTSDVDYFLDVASGCTPVLHVPHSENRTLRLSDAARYLAMSPASIATWRSHDRERPRGEQYAPPGFTIGSRVMFRLNALNEWIEKHLEPLESGSQGSDLR
jgi:predicted DNA-binding transcriptional regulator AlpA